MDSTYAFIFITSLWVLIDAKIMGVKKGQIKGYFNIGGAWSWFCACLLVWILFFPAYLIKRGEYKKAINQPQPAMPEVVNTQPPSGVPNPIVRFLQGCYWPLVILIVGFLGYSILLDVSQHGNLAAKVLDSDWQIDQSKDKLTDEVLLKATKTYQIDDGRIEAIAACQFQGVTFTFNLFGHFGATLKYKEDWIPGVGNAVSFKYRLDDGEPRSPVYQTEYQNSVTLMFLDQHFLNQHRRDILVVEKQNLQNLVASRKLLVRLPLLGGGNADVEINLADLREFFANCPFTKASPIASSDIGLPAAGSGARNDSTSNIAANTADKPIYYTLPAFKVPLTAPNTVILKTTLILEIPNSQNAVANIEANMPQLMDRLTAYLHDLHPEDLSDKEAIQNLRQGLLTNVDSVIGQGITRDVLFKDIVVE